MARAHPSFALRPFLIEDTPLLTEIFRASIEELAAEDYSEAARQAWASSADDEEAFAKRLSDQLTLIATMNGSPVAFASLANNETIDLLYVLPAVAGQGAGTMLVGALEKLAAARGASPPEGRRQRYRAGFLHAPRLRGTAAQHRAARRRMADQYDDGKEACEGESVMERPDTPFPRHWLYYVILKIVLIAAAVAIALKYFGFW